jgi:hypothetical protein
MPVLQDRVQVSSSTSGTGTLSLSGAITGYRSFNAAFSNGDVAFYTIDDGQGNWEIGYGTVGTNSLTRDAVLVSSNANALVNFGATTKRVFCSAPTQVLLPNQTGNSGKYLTTDGSNSIWTAAGAFTTLSASSTVSGTGFSNYLASPPAIGGSSPAAGAFTTLSSSSTTTVGTNLVFSGTGNRITGDFSNATAANRVAFQTSTANTTTTLEVIPNGTGVASQFLLETDQGLVNTSFLGLLCSTAVAESRITSGNRGTGTLFPLTFFTGGSERVRISTSGVVTIGSAISLDPTTANALVVNSSGNVGIGTSPSYKLHVLSTGGQTATIGTTSASTNVWMAVANGSQQVNFGVNSTNVPYIYALTGFDFLGAGDVLVKTGGGLGYGTGSGGTVTQATNKSTAVTLNKTTGTITMNNAALAAGASVTFLCNNSGFAASDVPVLSVYNNTNYRVEPSASIIGGFYVRVTNVTGGSLSEAIVINFAVIKGATS